MNLENKKQVMLTMYDEAKKMLNELCPSDIDLEKYFNLEKSFKTKNDILFTLLISLQDKQMSYNVIGILRPERKEIFKKLLFDFDCNMILTNYDEESLLIAFSKNFNINNIDSKQNLWRLYAKSVISSAQFLNTFNSAEEFDTFVNKYNDNKLELITLLQSKIYGLGFALACNFLKDLGYKDYSKPDVHIKDIFLAFDLCSNDEYSVFNSVAEMSAIVNDSAFNIDRLFWLICSGKLYLDDVNIGRHKEEFIERVMDKLDSNNMEMEQVQPTININDINSDNDNNIIMLGTTKCSKFKNNYKYDYARITLNDKITETFFGSDGKDKKVIDVIIKYDKTKDALIIEKIV